MELDTRKNESKSDVKQQSIAIEVCRVYPRPALILPRAGSLEQGHRRTR